MPPGPPELPPYASGRKTARPPLFVMIKVAYHNRRATIIVCARVSRMNPEYLIFYREFDAAGAWKQALSAELSDLEIRIYPLVGDPRDVRYALVWRPPAGFFAGFPNLSLITNLGAGVDALLDRD